MDLETENRIAAILMKEAADLRRQAEKEGIHAYLQQPNYRGRPNSRFLTATVLGVQQANRAAEVNEMWQVRQKELELDDRLKGRQKEESRSGRSHSGICDSPRSTTNRAAEVNEMWQVRQKELELDDRLKGRQKEESRSGRSHSGICDSPRSTSKRHSSSETSASASCSSSKRAIQDCYSREDEALRDEEIEEFLHSRVKRGRGTVGSRMDETGPYLPPCPDSKGKLLESPDVGVREDWEDRAVLGPEKPSSLKSCGSSKEESHDRRKKSKKVGSGSSSKQHSRKHRSKEKSRDKKKKRKDDKICKHHK